MTPIKFDKINFSTIQFERKEPSKQSYLKISKQEKLSKSKTPTKPKKEIKSYFYNPVEKYQKDKKTEGLLLNLNTSKDMQQPKKPPSFYEQILSGKKKSRQSFKSSDTAKIIIFEDFDEKSVEECKSISNFSQSSLHEENKRMTKANKSMENSEILKNTSTELEKSPENKLEVVKTEAIEKNEKSQIYPSIKKKSRAEFLPIQEEATELFENESMKQTQLKIESFDSINKYSNKNIENEDREFDAKPNPTPICISEIKNSENPSEIAIKRASSSILNIVKDVTEVELKEKEKDNSEKEGEANEKTEKYEDDDYYLKYLDEEIKT